jgi:hypothetical protein
MRNVLEGQLFQRARHKIMRGLYKLQRWKIWFNCEHW